MESKIKKTVESLKSNDFEVFLFSNRKKALSLCKKLIPSGASIGLGGSETVREIGLYDWFLKQGKFTLFNQYTFGISEKKSYELRRKGLLADFFVTGTNAITENGYLVNVDGTGNRVAGLIFGPKQVLVIAGTNKIVKNVAEGFKRIINIVAPLNVERLNKKVSQNSYTVDAITNQFAFIRRSVPKRRIKIILINENIGF